MKKNKINHHKKDQINIHGYLNARVFAMGPILYYLRDFNKKFPVYSLYWRVVYGGKVFLIDTGIKDIDYINSTVKGNFKWEKLQDIEKFDDIDYIFPTHLHYDHASGIYDYENTNIVLNDKTYNNLKDNRYDVLFQEKIYNETILTRVRNKENINLYEDGEEVITGVKTFWVGGHTPCSQILTFDLDFLNEQGHSKVLVFSGDIIPTYKNLKERIPGGYNYNLMEYFNFFNTFINKKYIIIPGHDKKALDLDNINI